MNDQEFEKLKDDIEGLMDRLEELQQIHIRETGRRFVRPVRLAPRKRPKSGRMCGALIKKEEQIQSLTQTLASIRDDYSPWHGKDAVGLMNFAHDTLIEWIKLRDVKRPKCTCAPDQGGQCSSCAEAKYDL